MRKVSKFISKSAIFKSSTAAGVYILGEHLYTLFGDASKEKDISKKSYPKIVGEEGHLTPLKATQLFYNGDALY